MHEIRMSASPGRAPQVIHQHEVGSPVRSVRPEFLLESINSQADFGPRTFLDNPSPEETHAPDISNTHASPEIDNPQAEQPFSKQRRSGHYLGGTTEQFQSNCAPDRRIPSPPSPRSPVEQTDFERYQQLTRENCKSGFDSDEDSYTGSVEEMTPVRPARRSNMLVDGLFHHSSPHVLEEESPILPKHQDLAVIREIKEMHHLTMQALTGITGSSNPSPTPPPIPTRDSRHQDWRNSRYRSVSAPAQKVTMAPPPIDTSRISVQQTHVKTPYPFRAIHRKEFGRQFSASEPTLRSPRVHDSILTLSIRRSNPNSWLRLSTLTIPANSEFSAIKNRHHSSDRSGQEYTPQDFDDAELFRQLRRHYQSLLGPWRHFSARSLTMICVSGDASRQADSGYGWLLTPRSPRTLAYKGLNDTFSEEKLLRFFHNPGAAGKSRYAWIETVEDMTGTMDPSANFNLIITQTELERFKFLIRSFLRARIAKLDKYPHHHLPSPNLSATESQYLTHRVSLLSHHFSTSFLSSFPAQLQKLDDTAGGISMVDAPDVDAAVFVRVLRDAGHVEVQGEQGVGIVELRRGDVWCVRWSAVKEACLRGDVEMV
ncbi:hypothetical protein KCU91_g4940, partial [Aureobasidium melanogenum]